MLKGFEKLTNVDEALSLFLEALRPKRLKDERVTVEEAEEDFNTCYLQRGRICRGATQFQYCALYKAVAQGRDYKPIIEEWDRQEEAYKLKAWQLADALNGRR